MDVQYNPLGIYIYGLSYLIAVSKAHYFALGIILVISSLNTFLFYKILSLLKIKINIKIFISSLFIFYYALLGGTYVYLETVTLFFILGSILLTFHNKFFFSGIVIFLAFYSKQYALFIIAPTLFFFFYTFSFKRALKASGILISGFLITLSVLYFIHSGQVDFSNYTLRLLGRSNMDSVVGHTGIGLKLSQSVYDFIKVMIFCLFIPYTILIIPYKRLAKSKYILFFLATFCCSLSVLVFSTYVYYYLLIMPWTLFILAVLLNDYELKSFKLSFFNLILVFTILAGFYTIKIIINKKNMLNSTHAQSEQIMKFVPPKSNVYLFIDPIYYYYTDYYSANNAELGYRFPKGKKFEYILKSAKIDSHLIISIKEYEKRKDNFTSNFIIIGFDKKNMYLKKI